MTHLNVRKSSVLNVTKVVTKQLTALELMLSSVPCAVVVVMIQIVVSKSGTQRVKTASIHVVKDVALNVASLVTLNVQA